VLKLLDRRRREEEGFTLIELMVVVLILGILMAIAIPTFLSTRSAASDSAAESNATNVTTAELSYQVNNSAFLPSGSGSTLDPSIPWITGGAANGKVDVWVGTSWANATSAGAQDSVTTNGNQVFVLESQSSSGDCFITMSDQTASPPVTAYVVTKGSTGCPGIAALHGLATEPTAAGGPGAAANKVAVGSLGTTWYSTW
jgi:type IV pilus assembly protein PilA